MLKIGAILWANIGHCPTCTRKAFVSAVLTWTGTAVLAALDQWPNALLIALLGAVGLTLLWFVHVVVFAIKTASARRKPGNVGPTDMARRASLSIFAKAIAAAAAVSAVPSLANAQNCPCGVCNDCRGGYFCACCNRACNCPMC
jgi:hypothetical protein